MSDKLRESLTLLPRRSEPRIWISKPVESRINKFIGGRSLSTTSLSVEGPAKNELCRAILFGSHSSEPMVNERELPNTGPCNDCNDVDILVCPSTIQKRDVLLSTKKITSCNGQSGSGNLLRRRSCWRLTSPDTKSRG